MKRVYKWLAWIVGVPVVGFALLVGAAAWSVYQDSKFPSLPPGERQLAIFDAFSDAVTANYFDREFIEKKWGPLRSRWRLKAAQARSDGFLYDQVFLPLSQEVPSSHIGAIPPGSLIEASHKLSRHRSDRGYSIAMVRRGTGSKGVVDEVFPGTPAATAGIEPGWVISRLPGGVVEHETGVFLALDTPELRLRSELLEKLSLEDLSIKTPAEFDARFVRAVDYDFTEPVERAPLETRSLAGVVYIRLDTFQDPKLLDSLLTALNDAGNRGVVLDLRRNRGGLVNEEMRLASCLLPEGALVGTQIMRGKRTERRAAAGAKFTGPLAVLIGPSTSSAGEVVAAALQDHRRARLLGRPTAGATLTSDGFPLPDGGSAQVAYADFLRADGRRIEGAGVTPDIGIMPTNADVRAARDPALERAITELGARAVSAAGSPLPPG